MSLKCTDCGKIIKDEQKAIIRTLQNGIKEIICQDCLNKTVGKSYFTRRSMNKIGCLLPFLGIVAIIFLPWQKGLIILGVSIIISLLLYKKSTSLFDEDLGIKDLKWCKNCAHFKKIKNWEPGISTTIKLLENKNTIPCEIFPETKQTWEEFIKLEWEKRALYPKNCPKWIKK